MLGDLIGCFGANSFISTSEFFIDDSMGKIGKGLTRQLFQRSAGQYQSLWWFWGIHVGESSQGGDPHDSVMTHDGQFGMLHSSTQTETGMCVCVIYGVGGMRHTRSVHSWSVWERTWEDEFGWVY